MGHPLTSKELHYKFDFGEKHGLESLERPVVQGAFEAFKAGMALSNPQKACDHALATLKALGE
jgi:hypothetical protein